MLISTHKLSDKKEASATDSPNPAEFTPIHVPDSMLGLQRIVGNQAIQRMVQGDFKAPYYGSNSTLTLRRQPATSGAGADQATFEKTLKDRFGVTTIRAGTESEQQQAVTSRQGATAGATLPQWTEWSVADAAPAYQAIIESFEQFNSAIGGVPLVREIIFFNMAYDIQHGLPVPRPDIGADFGAGRLTIYRAVTTLNAALPIGRSTAGGNYPPVGLAVGQGSGTPGAPLPYLTTKQRMEMLITHELGHGLGEAASAALGSSIFPAYQLAVGWTATQPARLFDIQANGVHAALSQGAIPASQYEITVDEWNAPKWLEQPLTRYSVQGGPGEDFAESVMAYIREPNLLVSRSPARFKFIDEQRALWLPKLLEIRQVGDFPDPNSARTMA